MMDKKRAIILDDEIPAIKRMENLITRDGRLEIASKFDDAQEAIEYCRNNDVDFIFADIEMPDIDGISFAKTLNNDRINTFIIYTTAYSKYTLDAYKNYAVGYLLKPIQQENFSELLDKLIGKTRYYDKLIIKSLGSHRVYCRNKTLEFRTQKAEEIFLYLLHNNGEFVTADKLIAIMWGDINIDKSKKLLYTNIYYCRKALKSIGFSDILMYKLGSYRLNLDNVEWDYLKLCSLLENNKEIYNVNLAERISTLYKGNYYEGVYYSWVDERRRYLNVKIQNIYNRIIDETRISNKEFKLIIESKDNTQVDTNHEEF